MELISLNLGQSQIIQLILQLRQKGKINPDIRNLAAGITSQCYPRDHRCNIYAIHNWIMSHIKFQDDINGVETLQEAQITVQLGYGDCDDFSILESSLLESIGIETRFVVGSDRPDKKLCHIWIEAMTGGQWIPLDASQGLPVGMEARNLVYKQIVQ